MICLEHVFWPNFAPISEENKWDEDLMRKMRECMYGEDERVLSFFLKVLDTKELQDYN